ncbi:MAG: hypothetical protein WA740_03480 [Candidatus Binataceae bacterium]
MKRIRSRRRAITGLIFLTAAIAALPGCWHKSAGAARQAEILKQCNAGEIDCVSPADSQTIIKCQSGDMPACQRLAAKKCDRGDQHVCQSLAVIYSQLKPLCKAGNKVACTDMQAPWPDAGFWRVDSQLAAAQTACKAGDTQSCQALGTTVHSTGGRLIWLQDYVGPAATSSANAPTE